jgi:hypothetical protein
LAERQQLVDLTTKIARHYTQEVAASNKSPGVPGNTTKPSQSPNVGELIVRLTVEGQAAALLIDELHGDAVTSFEYLEVGQALEVGGHTATAIKYYKAAVTAPPKDAETTATAQRYLANVYWTLGQYGKYHTYVMQAVAAFGGHLQEAPAISANSKAQAYLMDVWYQVQRKHCKDAKSDMSKAAEATNKYGQTMGVQGIAKSASDYYNTWCVPSL